MFLSVCWYKTECFHTRNSDFFSDGLCYPTGLGEKSRDSAYIPCIDMFSTIDAL